VRLWRPQASVTAAGDYNSLGGAWSSKGEYDKAIEYYEKALQINVRAFGDQHPNLARNYNSLGGAWNYKREYDKAIGYHEEASQINVRAFGDQHPKRGR
jgi:tetratricopeptide (TPR) repeat protein